MPTIASRGTLPTRKLAPVLVALALVLPSAARAAEGMWTLHDFPAAAVKEAVGADIGAAWLDRVQRATVRLDGGCTGSFASPQGLVLTNNHCTWGCIRDLSTDERNLSEEGFFAPSFEDEAVCPGARVSVLEEMEEITEAIRGATAGKSDAAANEARKAALSRLESECEEAGELSCESVDLYHGGQYYLYKYRRYDDVRLVFAPELPIAAFGGDPDNFNFPRWDLDMSFLRVYEDGKPAATPDFLPWKAAGAEIGEATFVVGHPGSTDRLLTVAQLEELRASYLPQRLIVYSELRGRMLQWAATSDEAARQVQQRILGVENGIKVWKNRLASLMDPEQMARKEAAERALRATLAADPQLAAAYGSAWSDVEAALAVWATMAERYRFIEDGLGFQGTLTDWAWTLVRGTREREKPNEERLREFRETALPRVEQRLLAASPVHVGYETLRLAFSLDKLREWLGPDDPVVQSVLGRQSPEELTAELLAGTRLADPAFRRELWEGGVEAVEASGDPLIALAREVEPVALALRKRFDDEVEAPLAQASEKIAKARFAVYGKGTYPDATFTLRVSYGAVRGWSERGEEVHPFTHFGRAFERATGKDPFRLPASWLAARDALDLDTRFNFASDNDIIGGNSGSPVVDAEGRLVGVAFDGNIHSIAGAYWFDETKNRTVSVHVAAMLEALRAVYGADRLLDELQVVP
ncbi:MAG: S46 family peptidase [Acidobacteriota bacterium]|nr:S46 family peptidase [Acidobacteriota bacterium]